MAVLRDQYNGRIIGSDTPNEIIKAMKEVPYPTTALEIAQIMGIDARTIKTHIPSVIKDIENPVWGRRPKTSKTAQMIYWYDENLPLEMKEKLVKGEL